MKSVIFMWSRSFSRTAIILFTVLMSLALLPGRAAAQPNTNPCRPHQYDDGTFVVCTVSLRKYEVRMFWRGPDGEVLGSFDRLRGTPEGSRLAFAMNAGMYHEDRSPVGLYVENGKELKAANTRNGPGNFHLKPNGIFYVKDRQAGVLETGTYLKRKIRPDFATQSGPMLVINGQIHPQFSEQSTSRKIRNGVGVKGQDTVVFAISEDPVTFSTFARLFRDELGCTNALFLDGSISSLYVPSLGRMDTLMPMGPIIGALNRRP
ncbi:phosphodiester glycosidase family protein [Microvirga splendida]|uniref:Phosphodiester glycosidase family protein n=1 Tax=Microvirga splendida TaxID=2795727 RepID=A0ABS0Y5Z4_9HYPH|nr:phosphodiester glycosidase family protein [Microvirga splendida]MBJ6127717.1 phosphodiester glycosidase family protein [Microvirga splendida]